MSGDEYLLARGYQASTRLNLQFYQWKEAMGYILHPSIPVPKDGNWKVADVATGTGIWICQLAEDLSGSGSFDGYDISSAQFPNPCSLPKNVTMNTLNAKRPPPVHLRGIYDVVHVRLLIAVIDDGDPTSVIKHCINLLKPGGYLQWDEMDPSALYRPPQSIGTAPIAPCLESLARIWTFTKPTIWISELPNAFSNNGCEDVVTDKHSEKNYQRQILMEIWCLVADDHAYALERIHGTDSTEANDLKRLASGAYSEIQRGAFFTQTFQTVVGRVGEFKNPDYKW